MSPVLNGLFELNIRDEKNHQNKVNDLLILKTPVPKITFSLNMHIVSRMKKRVFIILIILKRASFRQLLVCHCSNKKTLSESS